jgi:hypothetical protein
MERRALVLDANILIRAVLGQRVRRILEAHADNVSFFIPETAYAEAEEHLARLVAKHGGDPAKALAFLRSIAALGTLVGLDLYGDFETEARKRLGARAVRSGPRTQTSSAVASRPGSPAASTAFWCNSASRSVRIQRGSWRELTGVVDFAGTRIPSVRADGPPESHWFHHHCSPCLRP